MVNQLLFHRGVEPEHDRTLQDTERRRIIINSEVVRLLQEKTVPLNRGRYMHLQKISRAVCKDTPLIYTSVAQHTLIAPSLPSTLSPHRSTSSRGSMLTANLLLERLNDIKTLSTSSQKLSEEETNHLWKILRNSVLKTEMPKKGQRAHGAKTPHSQGRSKQEHLRELTQKTEKYLRVKKRDLRKRHCKDYYKNHMPTEDRITKIEKLEQTIPTIKPPKKGNLDKMMQRQLLRDIRQSMLEVSMSRMKRDINHKKIVQMR